MIENTADERHYIVIVGEDKLRRQSLKEVWAAHHYSNLCMTSVVVRIGIGRIVLLMQGTRIEYYS